MRWVAWRTPSAAASRLKYDTGSCWAMLILFTTIRRSTGALSWLALNPRSNEASTPKMANATRIDTIIRTARSFLRNRFLKMKARSFTPLPPSR